MTCMCGSFWKGGLSIDNLTRKQIWEENFKIRETLRGVQRSEHFWDFQMTNNSAECISCESPKKSIPRCKSLHRLDKISQVTQKVSTPSATQVPLRLHDNVGCAGRCRRDVSTETTPPRVDKSVGTRRVELHPSRDISHRPFIAGSVSTCPRYRPPDLTRNETAFSKQQRQDSLQKLRKGEEALHQVMQPKRIPGNAMQWGTEYTRSFKESGYPRVLGAGSRRAGTPMPRHSVQFPFAKGCTTPMVDCARRGTPLPRHAVG